jgi:hypothetical protein
LPSPCISSQTAGQIKLAASKWKENFENLRKSPGILLPCFVFWHRCSPYFKANSHGSRSKTSAILIFRRRDLQVVAKKHVTNKTFSIPTRNRRQALHFFESNGSGFESRNLLQIIVSY